MTTALDLLDETISHFDEGARSVRAYTEDKTFIITRNSESGYTVALEEPGFPKKKIQDLSEIFTDVFGIEAVY